jgi:hypothetical protein
MVRHGELSRLITLCSVLNLNAHALIMRPQRTLILPFIAISSITLYSRKAALASDDRDKPAAILIGEIGRIASITTRDWAVTGQLF